MKRDLCRAEVSLTRAVLVITLMTFLSLVLCSPLYFMAQIKRLVSFQDAMSMEVEDILICREIWPKGWRVTYKLCSCIFQFLGPVIIVVSEIIHLPN